MTKQEFTIKNLLALCELFDKKLSESLLEIYWMALKDFDIEDLKKGFNRAMRECKFFPKPVEIVDFIGCSAADKSLVAFGKLCDAIEDHGRNRSVAFDDPIIHSVVRELGGWEKCCLWEREELPFRQKDFERWYSVYLHSDRPHPAYIAGLTEIQNMQYIDHPLHGDAVKKSMRIEFIGDKEKAQALLLENKQKIKQVSAQGEIIQGLIEKMEGI